MRIPLSISPSLETQLSTPSGSASDPPLVFIDQEPFIVELQGRLELPPDDQLPGGGTDPTGGDEASRLRGSRVGKIDLSDPVSTTRFKKPTMRIAHHRLEGKLETLLTPYALLRTTAGRRTRSPSPSQHLDPEEPALKKQRPNDPGERSSKSRSTQEEVGEEERGSSTRIEIVGIVRKKIVFNKRPEPLIDTKSGVASSEPDPIREPANKNRDKSKKSLFG
ncbi:uncharacterized protein JCM15063_000665 [Sporobolomyces koalae]|uniref:uncharacterized protein n=1 Tax=Sporobolomyces koalae TaxID=500713 RepID=UPI00316F754D